MQQQDTATAGQELQPIDTSTAGHSDSSIANTSTAKAGRLVYKYVELVLFGR